MKVKELIDILKSFNPDSEVILAKDNEGNNYSPLDGLKNDMIYVKYSRFAGEVFDPELSAWDYDLDESDWEETKSLPKCVVLCPVN